MKKSIIGVLVSLLLAVACLFGVAGCKTDKFYEQENANVVSVNYLSDISSVYYYQISVECDDENLVFSCSTEYGKFFTPEMGMTVELKSGEYCRWGFDERERIDEVQGKPIYIDIIAKDGANIVGYGVVKIDFEETDLEDSITLLKFAFIPQVEGEYQSVSEKQIKRAMDKIKNN